MLLGDRAGEGALLVAEQLAFEQAGRNGGAVQLDERAAAAAAQVVNRAGDQLLAGAGFAVNEHGRIGRRDGLDLLQHLPERRALADDLLEVELGADLVFEVELLLGQLLFQLGDLLETPARSPRRWRSAGRPDPAAPHRPGERPSARRCRRSAPRARDRATGSGRCRPT